MTRKRKISSSAIILLAFIIVFSSVFLSVICLWTGNQVVSAANSNIAELWDGSSSKFNTQPLETLLIQLFGSNNYRDTATQINYIKGAKDTYTNSYVRSSVDIAANGEYTVTLGNVTWHPVSMTTIIVDGQDNAVLTLFATKSFGTSIYSSVTGNAANAYCCSDLRTNLLANANSAPFISGAPLSSFLVQPNNIQYQHTQSNQRSIGWATCPNDALDRITSGWSTTIGNIYNVAPTTQFGGKAYNDWGNDYIWIPSYVETGDIGSRSTVYYGSGASAKSIWKLSINQYEKYSSNEKSWRRTGHNQNLGKAYCSYEGNATSAPLTSEVLDIRPAIHINLTKVLNSLIYQNPQDMTVTFDGNSQAPSDLETKPTWWNTDFADTEKFTMSYQDSNNNVVSEIKNAGTYWVNISMAATYTDGFFDGTANTSDPDHRETDRNRWFKVIVNKKKIEVAFTNTNGTLSVDAKDPSELNCSDPAFKPVFGIRFTGVGSPVEPPNVPTKPGTYTATAVITNSTTCNFEIDTSKTYTTTYVKGKDSVTRPTIVNYDGSFTYKGSDHVFNISGYNSASTTINLDTLPKGVTYNSSNNTLGIKNAGTYKISFSLKSPSDNCWDDNSFDPVEYSITIKKKSVSVPDFDENMVNSSEVKNAPIAKVPSSKIGGVVSGDTPPTILILFQMGIGNEFNTYPSNPGKYKARLEIENAIASNYELDSTTAAMVVKFDVTGAVSFKESDLVWIATPNGGGSPITLSSPYELPFIMGGYTISIRNLTADNILLEDKGVKIYTDTATGDNGYSGDITAVNVAPSYTVNVRIVNYDNTFDAYDKTFSLNWKITPHNVTKPSYSGGDITFSKDPTDLAVLFGLPSDWADYVDFEIKKNGEPFTGSEISDIGTYVVKMTIKSSMAGNAVWDDSSPFPVQQIIKIIPRNIEITGWENTTGIPVPQTTAADDLDYLDFEYTKMDGSSATYDEVLSSANTTFNIKAVSKYGDNVVVTTVDSSVEDNETFSTPGAPGVPATPVPRPTLTVDSKEYTGAELAFELNGFDGSKMIMDGTLSVTEVGTYTVTIRFRDGVNYCWDDNTRDPFTLTFTVTEASAPPAPPEPSIGEKIKAFFDKLIEEHFPLWQVCTIAAGGLLSIIFLIKSIQYGNRKKKAKGEAKKYTAAKTMAALLPVFDTTVVAGLSNQIWSIIAFSIVGLTAVLFLTAIITRKGWKKAELAKEEAMAASGVNPQTGALMPVNNNDTVALLAEMRREMQETLAKANSGAQSAERSDLEQRLIEMEAQRREDEERHRQEMEAMKIMFANMMGRQQGADGMDMGYASMNDTDLIAEKVFAKLLPAVQQMIPEPTAYLAAPDSANGEDYIAMSTALQQQNAQIEEQNAQIAELQNQIASMSHNVFDAEIIPDNSEEIQALKEEHSAEMQAMNARLAEMQSKMDIMSSMSVDELDDADFDDEEEWDSILDEDDDDFVEAVVIDEDGKERKVYPNFRMRLKQSSDKNREWYAVIKNLFCSQKGVTYRVYKRVEKIRYQGQVIAVIGIAKRSIKLWLALKPYEYDARRYHHKDVSDKPRFVDVPMYVRVSSDRALDRSQELILALFQELNMEARKRYTDRPIQELIFTLKHNRLLTNKQNKQLLCETMHVHDCDVLDDETAEKCIEFKNVESLDESNIETVKLDDIDAKFQDGNRVTLDRLKKVGLVSEDCTGFTVTADKRLTKPLIIVANDFSLTAVKLITLTGGRAIKLQTI